MKILKVTLILIFPGFMALGGNVEKSYYFQSPAVEIIGDYHKVTFKNTLLSGSTGDPMLPWHEIFLMLPPGEMVVSAELKAENDIVLPGKYILYPQQPPRPVSEGPSGEFVKNEKIYTFDGIHPGKAIQNLKTQYLNGFAFALGVFTPVKYNPAKGTLSYFSKVTIIITTQPGLKSQSALKNLSSKEKIRNRVSMVAQNPEMMQLYPEKDAPLTSYDYLIISPPAFKNEFGPLISLYNAKGLSVKIGTTDTITAPGSDMAMKIRNRIISEYQNSNIDYILLAGRPALIPCRGFYCQVISTDTVISTNIPADLYYSGLDGTYNADADNLYGELTDDPDLLPDIAVARFTVNDTAELRRMIRKSVSYQTDPVLGEITQPLLTGEYLWGNPLTLGGDFMDLLIDDHADSGYFTHGIPSATNEIVKLYDSIKPTGGLWKWDTTMLLSKINQGRSIIHHLGHASSGTMLRLNMSNITNTSFASINGITHNYQILYTQGCNTGAFDGTCIAAKAVTINNFLVAGVFNSRYGWFNEGSSDGPSQHLHREFVSSLYHDTIPDRHLGAAHMISKIKTAPFVGLQGEWEPGAQRWVHYDCNAFGDPALEIWTEEPSTFPDIIWTGAVDSDWSKPGNWSPAFVPTSIFDAVIISTKNQPVITTVNTTFCHDLIIQNNAKVTIEPGKSLTVKGNVILIP